MCVLTSLLTSLAEGPKQLHVMGKLHKSIAATEYTGCAILLLLLLTFALDTESHAQYQQCVHC